MAQTQLVERPYFGIVSSQEYRLFNAVRVYCEGLLVLQVMVPFTRLKNLKYQGNVALRLEKDHETGAIIEPSGVYRLKRRPGNSAYNFFIEYSVNRRTMTLLVMISTDEEAAYTVKPVGRRIKFDQLSKDVIAEFISLSEHCSITSKEVNMRAVDFIE